MHYLVTQCIDSIEQNAEYCWGIAVGQRLLRCSPTAGKALGPLLLADLAVLIIPKALEHVGVVQQRANAAGELGPDQVFDQVGSVERAQLVQERLERGLLGKTGQHAFAQRLEDQSCMSQGRSSLRLVATICCASGLVAWFLGSI